MKVSDSTWQIIVKILWAVIGVLAGAVGVQGATSISRLFS